MKLEFNVEDVRKGIRETLTKSEASYFYTEKIGKKTRPFASKTIYQILEVMQEDEMPLSERIKVLTIYQYTFEKVTQNYSIPVGGIAEALSIISTEIKKYRTLIELDEKSPMIKGFTRKRKSLTDSGEDITSFVSFHILSLVFEEIRLFPDPKERNVAAMGRLFELITGIAESRLRDFFNGDMPRGRKFLNDLNLMREFLLPFAENHAIERIIQKIDTELREPPTLKEKK
jgi:hypothetical protein